MLVHLSGATTLCSAISLEVAFQRLLKDLYKTFKVPFEKTTRPLEVLRKAFKGDVKKVFEGPLKSVKMPCLKASYQGFLRSCKQHLENTLEGPSRGLYQAFKRFLKGC